MFSTNLKINNYVCNKQYMVNKLATFSNKGVVMAQYIALYQISQPSFHIISVSYICHQMDVVFCPTLVTDLVMGNIEWLN